MEKNRLPWENGILQVGKEKCYLFNGEKPFFWLADTGWLLFQRLTIEEADIYLRNRKEKGFNVIQVMLLHRRPMINKAGRVPFINEDLLRPDDEGENSYWKHVDRVLSIAEHYGIYLAMVPAWGDILKCGLLNEDTVDSYVRFLAERYSKRPNIIWIVGGDLLGSLGKNVWNRMGTLLRELCPNQLITFHPVTGTTSSIWFHEEKWIDFHMFQSGHSTYQQVEKNDPPMISSEQLPYAEDNWKYVEHDLSLQPQKPTLDAEPSYENIMKGLKNWGVRHWKAADVRRYVYWSVFAGALGASYGHNAIMQMFYDGVGTGSFGVMDTWKEALHSEGSGQMRYLKNLMERFPYYKGRGRQDLLAEETGERYERIAVFAGDDFLFAYTFTGREIVLKANVLTGKQMEAFWMNPENGDISYINTVSSENVCTFEPVGREGHANDWVLILVSDESEYF